MKKRIANRNIAQVRLRGLKQQHETAAVSSITPAVVKRYGILLDSIYSEWA
jgi:hypothetical protein